MRDLLRKIFFASAARTYSLLITLISLAITAKVLGPEGRGVTAAITAWITLFMTLGNLSLGHVTLHHATEKQGTPWLGPALGTLLTLAGVISLFGWAVALFLFVISRGEVFRGLSGGIVFLGFLSLPLVIWEQYGSSLLAAQDRVYLYNRAQMIGRTVGLLLLLFFLLEAKWGVVGALVALQGSQAMVALGGIRVLIREAKIESRVRLCRETTRTLLRNGLKMHLTTIGSYLFLSTDVLIVNHYRGSAETGYYQLAVQIVSMLAIPPQSAMTILSSRLAQVGPDRLWKSQRKVILGMMGVAGLLALGAATFAPIGLALLGGGKFRLAEGVFRIMLLNIFGMTLALLMMPQWIGRGLFWQSSLYTLSVGALNLIANLILVPRYGMVGSAWATVGTYATTMSVNLCFIVWIERHLRKSPPLPPNENSAVPNEFVTPTTEAGF